MPRARLALRPHCRRGETSARTPHWWGEGRPGRASVPACTSSSRRTASPAPSPPRRPRRPWPGWPDTAPHDLLTLLPLSDGGPGFLDVLASALGGETVAVTVTDPLGREVPAALLVVESRRRPHGIPRVGAGGRPAPARGRRAQPRPHEHLGRGAAAARPPSPRARSRIVVGLGGSGTNDGGAGLLAALGAGASARPGPGRPRARRASPTTPCPGCWPRGSGSRGVELVLATDVEHPLLGLQGASAVFGPQKGASPRAGPGARGCARPVRRGRRAARVPEQTGPADRARRGGSTVSPGRGLPAGSATRCCCSAAAGSAGWSRSSRRSASVTSCAAADLVVTGEGCFDWQSLQGKVVAGVAGLALETATAQRRASPGRSWSGAARR